MNNAWSEVVSCSPCFAFYCFSSLHWFIQTIWNNSFPSSDQYCSLILTLFFPCFFHYIFIDYKQSNALPPTLRCKHSKVDETSALVYESRGLLGQMPISSSKRLFKIDYFNDDLYCYVSYSNIEYEHEIFETYHQK